MLSIRAQRKPVTVSGNLKKKPIKLIRPVIVHMRQAIIILVFCYICSSCNNTDQVVNQVNPSSNNLQIVKSQFNKVELGYYVDYKKSPITKVYFPDKAEPTLLSIVNFIEESKVQNSCTLDLNIPDGHIEILKDSVTLLHLEFILKGDCKGFYSDFSNKPKKYDISPEGILELTKLMRLTKR